MRRQGNDRFCVDIYIYIYIYSERRERQIQNELEDRRGVGLLWEGNHVDK